MSESNSGRSSNPVPQTIPAGSRGVASLSSAVMTRSYLMPSDRPWSSRIYASAAVAVSSSPKKSATSGAYPPRRADAASARPDAAAISTAGALCIELARQLECIAKVEGHRFGRIDHALEQAGFGLVFDVADGERTDAERPRGVELRRRSPSVQAFDAGRRNGVDVGHDQKTLRLRRVAHLTGCARPRVRRRVRLPPASGSSAFFASSLPSATPTSSLEALLDLALRVTHPLRRRHSRRA